MTETAKKRRRWPWAILVVVLLLAGGRIAWRFRPLNAAELAIVGKWAVTEPSGPIAHFRPDHSVFLDGREIAEWSASANSLSLKYRVSIGDYPTLKWSARLSAYIKLRLFPQSYELTWDGADHFSLDIGEFYRVPDAVPQVADRPASP